MEWHKTTIGFLVIACLLTVTTCKKKVTSPDSPPTITSYQPSEYLLTQKVGDTINFIATATDADDDPVEYKTLKDGVQVNDTNTFEFIIDAIGGFRIQIIAYNTESDTAEWYVSVENQQPTISYMGHVNRNEDEIIIGEVVKSPTISDLEDDISELTVELSQTNSDLIKFVLDDNNQIIVNDYQDGASGISEVQYRVTDTGGYSESEGFHYIIHPMTDISGTILDTDTQEPNTALQAWVVINGDTIQTDDQGYYYTQTAPTSALEIQAGYKQNGIPISYITTIRDIDATSDVNDLDIAVVTYLNMNTTLEEFRIMMNEANFNETGNIFYNGAKALREDMNWHLFKKTDKYGQEYTEQEWQDLQTTLNIVNNYLKNPLPIILNYSGIFPETEEERTGKITISKRVDAGLGYIVSLDYNNNGEMDYIDINIRDPTNYPGAVKEEGASALAGPDMVLNSQLAGEKTIFYEYESGTDITTADIKAIRMIESITRGIGNLWPKMPIDDILKLQE